MLDQKEDVAAEPDSDMAVQAAAEDLLDQRTQRGGLGRACIGFHQAEPNPRQLDRQLLAGGLDAGRYKDLFGHSGSYFSAGRARPGLGPAPSRAWKPGSTGRLRLIP